MNAAATFRLAVLVSKDTIMEPARRALVGRVALGEGVVLAKREGVALFLGCPWCVGIWLAAIVTVLTKFAPGVWQYPAYLLALSAVAGFFGERTH